MAGVLFKSDKRSRVKVKGQESRVKSQGSRVKGQGSRVVTTDK
ncbi:MAG: hypothetical protein ACFKPT_11475 [Gloeotrichia echinulata GP01]